MDALISTMTTIEINEQTHEKNKKEGDGGVKIFNYKT